MCVFVVKGSKGFLFYYFLNFLNVSVSILHITLLSEKYIFLIFSYQDMAVSVL